MSVNYSKRASSIYLPVLACKLGQGLFKRFLPLLCSRQIFNSAVDILQV
jgi:hypothetical protein